MLFLTLKVFPHRELKLLDEYLLEGIEVVLLVEDEHRFLVVNRINGTKTQWAITVGNENCIAGDTCCSLIAIRKCLDVQQ